MKVLVTGCAGFIGFHLTTSLVHLGYDVFGIDNMNDYYDPKLKFDRMLELGVDAKHSNGIISSKLFSNLNFSIIDLVSKEEIDDIFLSEKFDYVFHLAAQAGVRYSLINPSIYIKSNIEGYLNILEACRNYPIKHLVYASSSSVYGLNTSLPFSEDDNASHPISLYAASKRSNELIAHSYSHLFNIPTTGVRFFTVYGPWGRPDMALFLFANAIKNNEPLKVFNNGKMVRDFTYVDDVISGLTEIIKHPPKENNEWDSQRPTTSNSSAPYRILNIGNSKPVELMEYINEIEASMGIPAIKQFLEIQPGDVMSTHASVEKITNEFNYIPTTSVKVGIKKYVDWFKNYYS